MLSESLYAGIWNVQLNPGSCPTPEYLTFQFSPLLIQSIGVRCHRPLASSTWSNPQTGPCATRRLYRGSDRKIFNTLLPCMHCLRSLHATGDNHTVSTSRNHKLCKTQSTLNINTPFHSFEFGLIFINKCEIFYRLSLSLCIVSPFKCWEILMHRGHPWNDCSHPVKAEILWQLFTFLSCGL